MPSRKELVKQIETLASRLRQRVSDAHYWHDRRLEEIARSYADGVAGARADHAAILADLQSDYERLIGEATAEVRTVERESNLRGAPWESAGWSSYFPSLDSPLPPVTRIGSLIAQGHFARLQMPALLPIIGGRNVIIKAEGAAKAQAVAALQSLMTRLLATMPPGKLQFVLVDPVGLGQNVAGFMRLADYDERLVGGKAWTEANHIEAQLAGLSAHMETIIQKFLRDSYPTMAAYNADAGEVAEPYRILVVMSFPVNFSESAARRLVSIASNGQRTGVHLLAMVDTQQPRPHGFNLADLERDATVISFEGGRFVWKDEDFVDCELRLDGAPPPGLLERILRDVGERAREASRVEIPFERVAPPAELYWQSRADHGLVAALGWSGAAKVQQLEFGKGTAQHALVVGKTGSGKSTLLHTLIASIAMSYSPWEVELYLVDFKKGVEFKTYASHQLPHVRVVAIESEREFGLSVLQGLDAELKRRGDLFRLAGVDNLGDYRQKIGADSLTGGSVNSRQGPAGNGHKKPDPLPRILLVVDEFQEFFVEDDALAGQAAMLLDRLVRQGRAFGIHLLLGTQTLAGAYTLARSTIDQMAVRIALQCSEADSRLVLADDNPAARLLSRPGEAIYNAVNGLVEGNNLFQVAWLPDDKRDDFLKQVNRLAQETGYLPTQPQIAFEGNVPATIAKNQQLSDQLSADRCLPPSQARFFWLGEPLAIKEPTAAVFRRQSRSNLLIVGQQEEAAMAMLTVGLMGLAAQHTPSLGETNTPGNAARFFIIDLSNPDAPWAGLTGALAKALPHQLIAVDRHGLAGAIRELAAETGTRLSAANQGEPPVKETLYLVLFGLHRARELQREDDYGYSVHGDSQQASLADRWITLCREGPDLGLHVITWCDTYINLMRALDRRTLAEFDLRIVFQMGNDDSNALVDSGAAAKLGPNRALFYDEQQGGRAERFRPYAMPSAAWLTGALRQIRRRGEREP